MDKQTLLFAVGGTGGHVYPAVALADQLIKADPKLSISFAGGGLKNAAYFAQQPYRYDTITTATLSVRQPLQAIKKIPLILNGVKESCRLIDQYAPSLVIGFGSYYSLPVLLAARWKNTPYVLHEQNTIPGRVIRLFSKGAQFTGIHFPGAKSYLKGETRVVGMPLRREFRKGASSRQEARNYFSLKQDVPVLLIFGGSQGATAINALVYEGLKTRTTDPLQVLHFTGSTSETEKFKDLYASLAISACVKDFEDRMDLAWQAADCVISRAGASSIAEQIEFEVPGILIPYPYAMDNHQEYNADFFVNKVQGGVKFVETQGTGEKLLNIVQSMIEGKELDRLRENISQYKRSSGTGGFDEEVMRVLYPYVSVQPPNDKPRRQRR